MGQEQTTKAVINIISSQYSYEQDLRLLEKPENYEMSYPFEV
jgi:hypothetical protein